MDEKEKDSTKNSKAKTIRMRISQIIKVLSVIVCCVSVLLGIAMIILSFVNNVSAGIENHGFGIIFHALHKWYYILLLIVGGPIALLIGLFISYLIYMSDEEISNLPKTQAFITGSTRMYVKGDFCGCTNCSWSGPPTYEKDGARLKCNRCGSSNCQTIYGTGLDICKDCGSFDTKLVCPKCGHDVKINNHG